MAVSVYTFAWNEEKILPHFFRHYAALGVTKIVVHDNASTDGTAALCDAHPLVERRVYRSNERHAEVSVMTKIRNTCWRDDKADVVILVDCDEFLWHNDFTEFLSVAEKTDNLAIVTATGFEMCSKAFPAGDGPLVQAVRTGVQSRTYSKPCLFWPKRVKSLAFAPGAHSVHADLAKGFRHTQSAGLRLLHYAKLGWDYYLARVKDRRARMDALDVKKGFNQHYRKADSTLLTEFNAMFHNAVDAVL